MKDIDFVKASATVEEFIDQCPRIELGIVELYLERMETYLSYLKKSK